MGIEVAQQIRAMLLSGEVRNAGEMHRAGVALLAGTDIGAPLGEQAGPAAMAAQVEEYGAVGAIGVPMFLEFGVQLQVTGILLLVAVVGAVMLAKRRV